MTLRRRQTGWEMIFSVTGPNRENGLWGERILLRSIVATPQLGLWRFEIVRLLAQGSEVVSEVLVSDGVVNARAITFHHVAEGKIQQQTEYWPDEYAAPEWRSSWVCPMPKS